MTVFSSDKKTIYTGSNFKVESAHGGKGKKFAIFGCPDYYESSMYGGRPLAYFTDEKTAVDAMQQLFDAMSRGDAVFTFADEV